MLTPGIGLLLVGAVLVRSQHPVIGRRLFAGVLLLLALRLLRNLWLAIFGRLGWGRLAIPGLLLLEGAAAFANLGPRGLLVKGATLGLLELGLLWLAWRAWRAGPGAVGSLPEEHLTARVQTFLGPRAARLVAMELVVLGGALRVMTGRPEAPRPGCFSYHRESVLGTLLLALPVLAIGDLLLLDLLLRHTPPWVRWGVHALDLYGLLWMLGLWQSMRTRPHRLEDGVLWLHRGVLGNLRVPQAALGRLQAVPVFDDPAERKAFIGEAANLAVSGGTELLLELTEPRRPMGFLGPGAPCNRVLFSVDDAAGLRGALGA